MDVRSLTARAPGRPGELRARLTELVDRAARIADVFLTAQGWRALVGRPPRSVASFRLMHALHGWGVRPATVIDVGANRGQFSNAAMRRWPAARVIAFEPVAEIASTLDALAGLGAFESHRVVLGASDGTVDFHVHGYTLSSSVLSSLTPEQSAGDGETTGVRPVPQRRLDGLLSAEQLAGPVLLKLDVQGYELEVLKGADGLLSAIDFIAIELSVVPAYQDQPLLAELNRELESRGFELETLLDVRREKGVIVETDALYRRTG